MIIVEWEKFRKKAVSLQSDLELFEVGFLDRDGFKKFADNLYDNINGLHEIRITGYFSETIRKTLEKIIKDPNVFKVRLICPEFPIKSKRDRRNLQALKKLSEAGAEIKVNDRLHARFLVACLSTTWSRGLLVIGSFDFNTECIGRERYDAGIKTRHPDLIESAVKLFDQIWNEPESLPLLERYFTEEKRKRRPGLQGLMKI